MNTIQREHFWQRHIEERQIGASSPRRWTRALLGLICAGLLPLASLAAKQGANEPNAMRLNSPEVQAKLAEDLKEEINRASTLRRISKLTRQLSLIHI